MKASARTHSRPALEAARILGLQIAQARRERRLTQAELAERAGTSKVTVRSAERGAPTVAIGTVFELATIVGVLLYDAEPEALTIIAGRAEDRLALLPESVRTRRQPVDDDF